MRGGRLSNRVARASIALAALVLGLASTRPAEAQTYGGTIVHYSAFGADGEEIHMSIQGDAAVAIGARANALWDCRIVSGVGFVCSAAYLRATGEQFHPSASTAFYVGPVSGWTSYPSGSDLALVHTFPRYPDNWVIFGAIMKYQALMVPMAETDHVDNAGGQFRVWYFDPEEPCGDEHRPEGSPAYHAQFGISTCYPVEEVDFEVLTGCAWGPG